MKKILSTFVLIILCISIFADINDDLIKAAEDADIEKVKQLIEQGADVDAKNEYGWTALMAAAWWGNTEIVKLLIQAGADVNAENIDGGTALIRAAGRGYTDVAELLIQTDADVNAKQLVKLRLSFDASVRITVPNCLAF